MYFQENDAVWIREYRAPGQARWGHCGGHCCLLPGNASGCPGHMAIAPLQGSVPITPAGPVQGVSQHSVHGEASARPCPPHNHEHSELWVCYVPQCHYTQLRACPQQMLNDHLLSESLNREDTSRKKGAGLGFHRWSPGREQGEASQ